MTKAELAVRFFSVRSGHGALHAALHAAQSLFPLVFVSAGVQLCILAQPDHRMSITHTGCYIWREQLHCETS